VTTERILSKEQTAEMGYLRRVLGATLRDKEHMSDIGKARYVKPLLRMERSQLCWFGHVSRMSRERMAKYVLRTAVHTYGKVTQRPSKVA